MVLIIELIMIKSTVMVNSFFYWNFLRKKIFKAKKVQVQSLKHSKLNHAFFQRIQLIIHARKLKISTKNLFTFINFSFLQIRKTKTMHHPMNINLEKLMRFTPNNGCCLYLDGLLLVLSSSLVSSTHNI